MSDPFISVIIPTYNRALQLHSAINSVFAQTYPNFEVIVVDDGSRDGTATYVQKVISERPSNRPQVRYFFQQNEGPSAARNVGIGAARGEWIAFLDSDDVWYRDKLEWQVGAVERFPGVCGACITDAKVVNDLGMETTSFHETGRRYSHEIGLASNVVERLARSFDHFWLTCLLVRTDLARQIGGFDSKILFAEDNDFTFRLSLVTSYCYINKLLVQVDRSSAPLATRPWEKTEVRLRHRQAILEKWLKMDATLPHEVRKVIVKELRQTHSSWANWYLETGQDSEACKAAKMALRVEPTGGLLLKWILARVAPKFARKITPKAKAYTS